MPSTHTQQLVKWIQLNANGWNNTGAEGIVPILDSVQNTLLQNETAQNLKYDTATGAFPLLATTDGVYEYEMPSDVWRVAQMLLTSPVPNDLDLRLSAEYGLESNVNPVMEKLYYNNREYRRWPFLKTTDSNPRDPCKVVFSINPTTTTDIYHYRSYKMISPRITNETVEIQISEKYDFTVTIPTIMLIIEAFQTGNWYENIAIIEQLYKPKLIEEMNSGEQGLAGFVTRNEF